MLGTPRFLEWLGVACVYLSFSFPVAASGKVDSALQNIEAKKLIKVCSEAGYVPFEMKDDKGNWFGFDIDVVKEFAKDLKVKIEIADIKWDSLIPTLLSGKCDMIASSMAMTQERERTVLFSNEIYTDEFAYAVLKERSKDFPTFETLNKEGLRVSSKTGSSADLFLKRNNEIKKATIVRFEADIDVVHSLKNRKVDVIFYNKVYLEMVNKQLGNIFSIHRTGFGEKIGFAFSKKQESLKKRFDEFLVRWKKSEEYKKSFRYYLEEMSWVNKK